MAFSDPTDSLRTSRRSEALVVCCADLLFLMALAVADRLIRPHVGAGEILPAAIYALCFWTLAGLAYCLLTAVFLRRYRAGWPRGQQDLPRPRSWQVAYDHATPGLFALVAILLPYAALARPFWLAATGGIVLVFALWPSRDGSLAEGEDLAGQPAKPRPEHAAAVEELRTFAAHHCLDDCSILVVPGRGQAVASCAPTKPIPTIGLSEELVDLLSPAERRAVFSHELGHHRLKHSSKAIHTHLGLQAVCVILAGIVLEAARPAAHATARGIAGAAPNVLLVWYILMVLVQPIWHAFLRRQERQAHRRGLEMTRDPASLISAVGKLARHNDAGNPSSRLQTLLLSDALAAEEITHLAREWGQANGVDPDPPETRQDGLREDPPGEEDPKDPAPEVGFLAIMTDSDDA